MTILHLSDTHNLHRQLTDLPDADIIIHSGDFTMVGTKQEAIDFLNWFCDLPYRHKIFIAGNHDECLYGATLSGLDENCHYLCHSGICIEGVNFYGIPMFVGDAINGKDRRLIQAIPMDTDVLITHQPPLGILDYDNHYHYGSEDLWQKVNSIKPKFHLFGHIHTNYGIEFCNEITFSNASMMDAGYLLRKERMNVLNLTL